MRVRRRAPSREFVDLLLESWPPHRRRAPSRSRPSRADADVVRAEQRRQRRRDAAQQRLRLSPAACRRRRSLLRFDLLPPRPHLAGGVERRFAGVAREDVRMPAHELVGDALERVGDREVPRFALELREEHRLEHEVAELLAERRVIVAVDRLEHLVGLLEHERLQRVDRLLAIPRTAVRSAQSGHDVDQAR